MRAGVQASISAFEALLCADDTGEKELGASFSDMFTL